MKTTGPPRYFVPICHDARRIGQRILDAERKEKSCPTDS